MSPLAKRCLSALVLAPPVLAAIYFGSPYSDLLAILCGGLIGWEWVRLCSGGRWDAAMTLVVLTSILVPTLAAFEYWQIAGLILPAVALVVLALAWSSGRERAVWLGFGVVYVGLFCLAFQAIRLFGWEPMVWLFFVVWATDTGAYFAGRAIGGPKLAPRISPNKTWAGLIGGMILAAAIAALLGLWFGPIGLSLQTILIAMGLAVVAQMGDLLESFYKRRYDVKDSSSLIPGHGGILDRVDGLMAAAVVLVGFMIISIAWAMG